MRGRVRGAGVAALLLSVTDVVTAGDRELGQYLSSECVTCHQLSGRVAGGVPPIVGWPVDQFIAVMAAYKTKQLDHPVMQSIAARLNDEDIAALAAYFADRKTD
jgi:cytochrome c553